MITRVPGAASLPRAPATMPRSRVAVTARGSEESTQIPASLNAVREVPQLTGRELRRRRLHGSPAGDDPVGERGPKGLPSAPGERPNSGATTMLCGPDVSE